MAADVVVVMKGETAVCLLLSYFFAAVAEILSVMDVVVQDVTADAVKAVYLLSFYFFAAAAEILSAKTCLLN